MAENNEFDQKYQKCKYRIKVWEKKFKVKYGRVPSKVSLIIYNDLALNDIVLA